VRNKHGDYSHDASSIYNTNLSEHEIDVLQRREQHTWFVNLIPRDALGPGLAYSFGFYEEFGHPEIIIFGLAEEMMHG
jgi:hypothetical protein